jgi:hypothetical protein
MRSPLGRALSAAAVVVVVGCGQSAPNETVVVSTADTLLTLGSATPERVAGHFTRDGVTIAFDSIRTATVFRFEILNSDGSALIRGDQRGTQQFDTNVLGGRGIIHYDLAATDNNVSYEGDTDALTAAQQRPEYAVLPWLSHALGDNGFNGRDYPATLALHMFNRSVAEKMNIVLPKVERPELSDETGYCTAYPNSSNACYGMCGRGCSCWSFVCGDCCYHNGCARHDSYCRGSGFWDTAKCWTAWGAAFFGC